MYLYILYADNSKSRQYVVDIGDWTWPSQVGLMNNAFKFTKRWYATNMMVIMGYKKMVWVSLLVYPHGYHHVVAYISPSFHKIYLFHGDI